jgi:integrase/recombinase XerD
MTEFVFNGPFQQYIQEMIHQKQSLGYKYDSSARSLYKFDQFCLAYGCTESTLSKDLAQAWSQKRPNEAHETLSNRIVVVRQLAMYMNRIGVPAYVLPKNSVSKGPRYTPYIFSNEELAALFKQADACHYRPEVPHRQWIMPLLFRMLYGCGLRISEALHLRLRHVDLDTGVLTILDGKLNKDRLVPLSAELHQRCHAYVKQVHTFSDADAYFFQGPNGEALTQNNAYKNFRKFLWRARISHGGWGKGPRLHDFRHTFAVHLLTTLGAGRERSNRLSTCPQNVPWSSFL